MTDVEMARQAVGRWKATAEALARDIWSYAELPYCETKSAAALCGALEREGFSVETHVAGIPTCFTAVFRNGTGTPVVGLLAEFDALDGLSQQAALPLLWPFGIAWFRRDWTAVWFSSAARRRKAPAPNSLWPEQGALTA